jgi:hypothetical protein
LRNAGGDKQVTVNFDQRSMLQDIAGLLSYPSIRVHVLMMESTYNEDQGGRQENDHPWTLHWRSK